MFGVLLTIAFGGLVLRTASGTLVDESALVWEHVRGAVALSAMVGTSVAVGLMEAVVFLGLLQVVKSMGPWSLVFVIPTGLVSLSLGGGVHFLVMMRIIRKQISSFQTVMRVAGMWGVFLTYGNVLMVPGLALSLALGKASWVVYLPWFWVVGSLLLWMYFILKAAR